MSDYQNSIGSLYGQLTVVELLGQRIVGKSKHRFVKARCVCGNHKETPFQELKRGRVTTCGCRLGRVGQHGSGKRYSDPTQSAFNALYNHVYKAGAIKRGYAFDLTPEQFRRINKMNCHYCGSPPRACSKQNGSEYTYNGVDRVDNTAGYTLANVVPCCTTCNIAKRGMGHQEFLDWARRVVEHSRPVTTFYESLLI